MLLKVLKQWALTLEIIVIIHINAILMYFTSISLKIML